MTRKLKVGWLKWQSALGILRDRWLPAKLKEQFYRMAVRPAMFYSSEYGSLELTYTDVAEMTMLR